MATWDEVRELALALPGEKRALIAAEPAYFFTVHHFDGHPAVLARLDAIPRDRLAKVITDAWLAVAPKKLIAGFESRG